MPTGRSRIYAPRIKGDLDLALENARIKQTGLATFERDWSRIITPGGLLPGGVWQDIHQPADDPNFRIATRMAMDERVFRYAKIADAGIDLSGQYGAALRATATTLVKTNPDIIQGLINTYAVTLDMGGAVAKDAYQSGYMGIKDASVSVVWGAKILGNDISDPITDHVVFYLEAALPFTIDGAADTVSVTPNPYMNVVGEGVPSTCKWFFVGVPLTYYLGPDALLGKYLWLQTWGPIAEMHIATSHHGNGDFERALYFMGQGAVQMPADATGAMPVVGGEHAWNFQKAGYYMTDGTPGALNNPVVWLTIAP